MFQIGDEVSAFGLKGTVLKLISGSDHPVLVKFSNGQEVSFTQDGKYFDWAVGADLELVDRYLHSNSRCQIYWTGDIARFSESFQKGSEITICSNCITRISRA